MKEHLRTSLLPDRDAILNKFAELRRRLESGLSYKEYIMATQQLYADCMKNNSGKYRELIKLYMDLKDRWYAEITSNNAHFNYYDYLVWKTKYNKMTECFNLRKANIKNSICEVLEKSIHIENGLK